MTHRIRSIVAALAVVLAAGLVSAADESQKDKTMTKRARGEFDVKVNPVAQEPYPDGISLGRFSLDKQYRGELEAAGKGEMLTAGTPVEGSAGYVAFERVDGTLHGKRGTFVLQHLGRMGHGAQHMAIAVLPDSATGELQGLEGKLEITIADGKHFYELEYTLPEK